MKLFWRSLWFYLGLFISLLVYVPVTLPGLLLPYPQRYRLLTCWAQGMLWWLKITCQLTYQVTGVENLPTTPAIILSKHQSAWETIAFARLFPMQTWVLKRELLWLPLFGWALATLRPIAIKRQDSRRSLHQLVEQGKQRLASGLWVVIFPEGTRVAVGARQRYQSGGAWLGISSGVPIVPVAHNAGVFWPRQGFIKHPGTIQVVVGPVIDPRHKTAKEVNLLVEEWIENTLLTLKTTP